MVQTYAKWNWLQDIISQFKVTINQKYMIQQIKINNAIHQNYTMHTINIMQKSV
jgi:hypothetical protein